MKEEKSKQLITIIKYSKVFIGTLLGVVWIAIILTISNSPLPFSEQAPYCMGTTIIIFMILSGIYKGLDYLNRDK